MTGGLLPDGAGPGLEPLTVARVPLVEHAVAERVLTGQVRADAQVTRCRAGDDRVLVLAEHRLDLLHPLGEPGSLPADGRAHRLGRIAGPPGRLARLVQRLVPLLARGSMPGTVHPPARLPA